MSQRQQRLHSGLDRPREPETVLPVKTVCPGDGPGTARDGAAAGRRVRLGTARQVTRERPSVASLTPRGRQAQCPLRAASALRQGPRGARSLLSVEQGGGAGPGGRTQAMGAEGPAEELQVGTAGPPHRTAGSRSRRPPRRRTAVATVCSVPVFLTAARPTARNATQRHSVRLPEVFGEGEGGSQNHLRHIHDVSM